MTSKSNKYITSFLLINICLVSVAQAQTFGTFVNGIVDLINSAVAIIVAASLLLFFWGMAKFISKAGDTGEHQKGKNLMIWGTLIFFVMSSLWGILRLMGNSIF